MISFFKVALSAESDSRKRPNLLNEGVLEPARAVVTALRSAFLLQPKSLSEQKIYSTAIYTQLKVLSGAILRSDGR